MRFLWHDDLAGGGTKYRYTFGSDDGKGEAPVVADLFEYSVQSPDTIGREILSTYNELKQFKAGFDNMAENLKMAVVLAEGALRQADMLRAIEANREKREHLVRVAKELTQIALGITPAGNGVDFYEMWYGKDIYGNNLSREQRLYAAMGIIAGNRLAWEATVGTMVATITPLAQKYLKGISSKGDLAFEEMLDILDRIPLGKPVNDLISKDSLPDGSIAYVKKISGVGDVTVVYNKYGFPDFGPFVKKDLKGAQKNVVTIELTGSRLDDFKEASKKAGFLNSRGTPCRPKGYTWHHDHRIGVMMLVKTAVHKKFPHTGGVRIWEEVTGLEYPKNDSTLSICPGE
ncbi:HNH endonuclease [Pseudobacteriovorax antillogorgiicola]|uniref:DNase/tRNase domain of colicin-like bacteriocin n=1 Tax=Pseudobacteriovorax antillogorgiicola TaxID=1513793 RepID=A0A1Y6BQN1_9BACT|nr:HNH endonuclease [Pseudobacteriovorax antillogorgiicola]TCS53696.1 colicin-lik bacteriocin with DNase/tRNase domain [Pseudobacteriovorax antillogorgiicola]SMF23077.1 DNase/tRNase domain of colicin-like bacteriocin [Pseudobacteriovorax antillogorgiicola]